jgi:hypothetical protein
MKRKDPLFLFETGEVWIIHREQTKVDWHAYSLTSSFFAERCCYLHKVCLSSCLLFRGISTTRNRRMSHFVDWQQLVFSNFEKEQQIINIQVKWHWLWRVFIKVIAKKENSVNLQMSHAEGISTQNTNECCLNKPIWAVVPWISTMSNHKIWRRKQRKTIELFWIRDDAVWRATGWVLLVRMKRVVANCKRITHPSRNVEIAITVCFLTHTLTLKKL